MEFRHFILFIAGFATPALSETLVSGAIYFDSENTLQEVVKLSGEKDNDALARLVEAHHVNAKLTENTDISVYLAGPNPESPAEFRFINNPTTYWTLTKFIEGLRPASLPVAAIPTPTPNPTPTPDAPFTPSPTPKPTPPPTPKTVVAMQEREEASPPPLRKQHRRVVKEHSFDEEVPEVDKVWHQVNGHWKWYDKRNLHEVRRATPVSGPTPAPAPTPLPLPGG